jgi:hypothetical protein
MSEHVRPDRFLSHRALKVFALLVVGVGLLIWKAQGEAAIIVPILVLGVLGYVTLKGNDALKRRELKIRAYHRQPWPTVAFVVCVGGGALWGWHLTRTVWGALIFAALGLLPFELLRLIVGGRPRPLGPRKERFYQRRPWPFVFFVVWGLFALASLADHFGWWIVPGLLTLIGMKMMHFRIVRLLSLRRRGYFPGSLGNGGWVYEERDGHAVRTLTLPIERYDRGEWELIVPTEDEWRRAMPEWALDRRREIVLRIAERVSIGGVLDAPDDR